METRRLDLLVELSGWGPCARSRICSASVPRRVAANCRSRPRDRQPAHRAARTPGRVDARRPSAGQPRPDNPRSGRGGTPRSRTRRRTERHPAGRRVRHCHPRVSVTDHHRLRRQPSAGPRADPRTRTRRDPGTPRGGPGRPGTHLRLQPRPGPRRPQRQVDPTVDRAVGIGVPAHQDFNNGTTLEVFLRFRAHNWIGNSAIRPTRRPSERLPPWPGSHPASLTMQTASTWCRT